MNITIKYLVVLSFFACFFSSCAIVGAPMMAILQKKAGVENTKVLYNPVLDKEIVLIPLMPSNNKKVMEQIPAFVDSLRKEGYAIYYPSLQFNFKEDSLVVDSLQRKYRKVAQSNYDMRYLYSMAYGAKFRANSTEKLGVNDSTDFLVDWYMNDLVRALEARAGKIVLDSCDWNTSLFDEYKCKKGREGAALAIELYMREEAMFHQVLTLPQKKAAVLFEMQSNYYFLLADFFEAGFYLKQGKI